MGPTPLINQQFGYVRLAAPLLDFAGISTEFNGAISTQFCFSYSLGLSPLCRAGYTLGSVYHCLTQCGIKLCSSVTFQVCLSHERFSDKSKQTLHTQTDNKITVHKHWLPCNIYSCNLRI